MLAYDMPVRGDPPRRQVGSHCFDALVYQRALFPLMPGRFAIPPAQLVYSLPLSASFFSREETHELQTDSTVIVAVEPPAAGASGSLRRGGGQSARRVQARHGRVARWRSDPPHRTRVGLGEREVVSAARRWRAVGVAGEGRRARSGRLERSADFRREGVRLGADAHDRRRARSAADSLHLLQSGFAALRSRVDEPDASARQRGRLGIRRHRENGNAAAAARAVPRACPARRCTSTRCSGQ